MAGPFKRDHWDLLGEEIGAAPPAPTGNEPPEVGEPGDLGADETAATGFGETGEGPEAETAGEPTVSFDLNDIAAPDPFPMLTVEMEPEPKRLAKPEADASQPGWGAPRKPKRRPERPRPEKRTWTAALDLGVAETEEVPADADQPETEPEEGDIEEGAEARSKRRRRRRGGRRKAGDKSEPEVEGAGGSEDATEDAEGEAADETTATTDTPREPKEPERKKKEGKEGRPSHRNIPTWEEAINMIISGNMEHRAKNPSPNHGSRPPHGRGRGRPRSGNGPAK